MLDRKVENRGTNVKWRITTLLPFSAAEVSTEGSETANSSADSFASWQDKWKEKSSKTFRSWRGRRGSNPTGPSRSDDPRPPAWE
jgi:hypothetical protein